MKAAAIVLALILGNSGVAPRAEAQGKAMLIPTRPGVQTSIFWMPVENAKGTVLFFPGGVGGLGLNKTPRPSSNNYIADTHDYLAANGYSVLMFGLPSDVRFLDITSNGRVSDNHLADIRAVLEFIRQQSPGPIWVMGFSAGAISAAFAAIGLQDTGLAGLVLTSAVFRSHAGGPGAPTMRFTVSALEIERLRIPVLVYHHEKDECGYCDPAGARELLPRLVNAPIRKLMMVTGGANPAGNPCYNRHWHGFPDMEKAAIDQMTEWMNRPTL